MEASLLMTTSSSPRLVEQQNRTQVRRPVPRIVAADKGEVWVCRGQSGTSPVRGTVSGGMGPIAGILGITRAPRESRRAMVYTLCWLVGQHTTQGMRSMLSLYLRD